jgi:predicted ArsR family transcriptional regulator
MSLTLTGLRDYLKLHHNASLADMAVHFDASEDAVRAGLDQWVAKGKVVRLASGSVCSNAGSGCGCGCKMQDLYEWREPARATG